MIKQELKLKDIKLPSIIAVSKTFQISNILPLIDSGHIHFGENKVQEAVEKWTNIKAKHNTIKLHMIGKLQTNKVKFVIPLFDYIHSLDSEKLAKKISDEQKKLNKKPKIFIQINIGKEVQKNGIDIENLENFYLDCKKKYELDIVGLMCLPPNDNNPNIYFSEMLELLKTTDLKELSMGMTNDYIEALKFKSTYLRIGSKIFGSRS